MNMLKRNLILFIAIFSLGVVKVNAQLDAVFSQYMFNPMVINPAYAGYHEMTMLTFDTRAQWLGLAGTEGAPITNSLNVHSNLPVEKMGAGFTFVNDRIGVVNNNQLTFASSYQLRFGERKLCFGLQGDVNIFKVNYDKLPDHVQAVADPTISYANNISSVKPNFGTGVLYSSDKVFFGASVPRLLVNKIESQDYINNIKNVQNEKGLYDTTFVGTRFLRHYYITGGYIFKLTNMVVLKPSFLIRSIGGVLPSNVDLNCSLLLRNQVWLGLSLRHSLISGVSAFIPKSIAVMGQLQISDEVKIGYATELVTVPELLRAVKAYGTHELMLNVNFNIFKRQAVQTIYY